MLDEFVAGAKKRDGIAAIIPHAGWVYSGATAALGIAGVAETPADTVVVFGAVHVQTRSEASLWAKGVWRTPLGAMDIDEELAAGIATCDHVSVDESAHLREHAIEVEVPLIQRLLGDKRIVPLMVRPGPNGPEIGRQCAEKARELGKKVVFLGSTDLTHYGPGFGFEPEGRGATGIRWAKEVNDRRFVKLIEELNAPAVVPEATARRNACGAGAVAATIGAALEFGATRYEELAHTSSAEIEIAEGGYPLNSVGYEAGIFLTK
jgi:AmmeMemoRadiSam system protein B